jgi:hypothetical protein
MFVYCIYIKQNRYILNKVKIKEVATVVPLSDGKYFLWFSVITMGKVSKCVSVVLIDVLAMRNISKCVTD